jgi:putative ribosome biogenesis GTPase RsgA
MTLELPSFIILSKCDLIEDKKKLKRYTKLHKFNQDSIYTHQDEFSKTYKSFTQGISELITSFGVGKLLTLDISDDESVENILAEIDYAIQYGDNLEPDDKLYD